MVTQAYFGQSGPCRRSLERLCCLVLFSCALPDLTINFLALVMIRPFFVVWFLLIQVTVLADPLEETSAVLTSPSHLSSVVVGERSAAGGDSALSIGDGTNAMMGSSIIVNLMGLSEEARPLELVLIPAGSFQMGCPIEERGRVGREWPPHRVTVSRPFYIGRHEVTQAQWLAVMGTRPASGQGEGPDHPVYSITWNDAKEFTDRLSELGQGHFRLPSEAEWEYACRAGTTTRFSFGDALESSDVRDYCNVLDTYMWWGGNNGQKGYTPGCKPVGLKARNPWGLLDMHGNLWEWCWDWWEPGVTRVAQIDPRGPATGTHKVMRGGAWESHALHLRSADRSPIAPDSLEYGRLIGLRLVREWP
jgi:formylglycine-generating enzyme required for sulfatase activity